MPVDTEHILVSWVRRLEQSGADSLLATTNEDWPATLRRLSAALDERDFEYLSDQLTQIAEEGRP